MIELLMALVLGFGIGGIADIESKRIRAIESVKYSTVSIVSSNTNFKQLSVTDIPLLGQMQEAGLLTLASGSGVIIKKDGHLITNKHVVENGKFFQVRLYGETPEELFSDHSATLVGVHPDFDLAVLKIDGTHKPIRIDHSPTLGESVFAIGAPLGLTDTITSGIVSNVCRIFQFTKSDETICSVQTDASINSGNSGGGLFNLDGELVGINTANVSKSGDSVGLGFALIGKRMYNLALKIIEAK